jgi:hypothetical protein
VGLTATGLPPRSSPDPGARTRVVLVHGAIGIRDDYISSVRPGCRVRKLLATRSCTEGVTCDTAALDCSNLSPGRSTPPLLRSRSSSSKSSRSLSLRKSTAHTALLLSPRNREGSTGSCHHAIYSTSPAGTRALHATRREIDHAALPLPQPTPKQATRHGLCYARPTTGAIMLSEYTEPSETPPCKAGRSSPVQPPESSYPGRLVIVPGARSIFEVFVQARKEVHLTTPQREDGHRSCIMALRRRALLLRRRIDMVANTEQHLLARSICQKCKSARGRDSPRTIWKYTHPGLRTLPS